MSASPVFLRRPVNAQALRQARYATGLGQVQLAVRSGLGLRTIVLAEGGFASRRTIERLSAILCVPAHEIAPDLVPPPQPPAQPIDPRPEFKIAQEAVR